MVPGRPASGAGWLDECVGNDLGRRLKYWMRRLRTMRVRNILDTARRVHDASGKPVPLILADMVWCTLRYESGYADYEEYEYFNLNGAQRRTMLSAAQNNRLIQRYNPIEFRYKFQDKREFNRIFADYLGRQWLDVEASTTDELRAFLARHPRVMVKPISAEAGAGIEVLRAADVTDHETLHARLTADGPVILEEFVTQHPELSRLAPDSVNTIRIVTFRRDDTVTVLARVLKMGTGAPIDNFGAGGVYTTLDEAGVALYGAIGNSGRVLQVHPQTGVEIVGFQVPRFAEVLALADRLARVVPEIPYVGWDIAVTPDGPIVIEGNENTGLWWMRPSLSGVKEGLLPAYREAMGF